ncbi:MAG: FecR domain-containing protein [Sulfurovaceae bacterium]|nr:FecR domain-containing protein [Sulfurovaceae bacterium]
MLKIIILFVFLSYNIFSQNVGLIKSINGTVNIKRDNKIISIKKGDKIKNKDIIITKANSSIGIIFNDGSRLSLGSKSIFKINNFIVKPDKHQFDVNMKLEKGKALFSSGKIGKVSPKSVKFKVPEGVVGIRGTEFLVEVK